ncbi:hypothetical protein VN12_18415 [Pirellula sp. SH-Sr6A]|uniref:hypothetical protein n=1 Tax=Pirellula sp. SH-Sr6A TaxID=1632865 RepID=UPI00078B76EF|nr:hypothetical protein [Pirellula sp. SH-Sr6A]AMV34110.1 hypothetical protein VN12_18415 [Pirellula sp. SH-Sr6A]
MPRALCLSGLVIAGLVFLLFLVNLIMSLAGMGSLFRYQSLLMDIVFLVCSGTLGYLSWSTFRELK